MSGPILATGPETEGLLRILLLQDFNTRIVVAGAMLLGAVGGLVGTFLMFRRRALIGDVLGHAMLPGVAGAFLLLQVLGFERNLPGLLTGGAVAATLAGLMVLGLRKITRLGDDAVMAIVLSGFFGFGVVLLSIVQTTGGGGQAGLEDFVFGKTASMVTADVVVIAIGGLGVAIVGSILFKDLGLLCFDESFSASIGRPSGLLDLVLLTMAVLTALIGLQAVGLVLVVAVMVIPPAAARFITDDLRKTVLWSSGIGATGCWIGVTLSAVAPGLPAGAMIVLSMAGLFVVTLVLGGRRGLVPGWLLARRVRRRVGRDHLLRSMLEHRELTGESEVAVETILGFRVWSAGEVSASLRAGRRVGEVVEVEPGRWRLSERGELEAIALVRNHRLWEYYLLRHADIAASHVDRAADRIEHVLDPVLVRSLEVEVGAAIGARAPESPHPLGDVASVEEPEPGG
ncbi:MAG: iron ABC transporter [Planctomycetaceae bacterium]|nr:iron ABC transporter [Planctomycetaceae bacterium]